MNQTKTHIIGSVLCLRFVNSKIKRIRLKYNCITYVIQLYTGGADVYMAKKEVISIRVSTEFKSKLESEAGMKDMSVSEFILETLNTPEVIKMSYEEKLREMEQRLENSIMEKNKIIDNHEAEMKEIEKKTEASVEENKELIETLRVQQDLFSNQQKLLDQQQQLQLFTQKQVEQLQQEKQMLIETDRTKKRWWEVWR